MAKEITNPIVSGIIRIAAEGIDEAEVLRKVEENLARRPTETLDGNYIPSYDDLLEDADSLDKRPTNALEYYLWRLSETDITVTRHIIPSNVPILGRTIDFVKEQFHNLVLYYVNIVAGKQSMFNVQTIRALRYLRRELEVLKSTSEQEKPSHGGKP